MRVRNKGHRTARSKPRPGSRRRVAQELVKGFRCRCGEYHRFPPYVYAHWNIILTFTCPKCNRKCEILQGQVTYSKDTNEESKDTSD